MSFKNISELEFSYDLLIFFSFLGFWKKNNLIIFLDFSVFKF